MPSNNSLKSEVLFIEIIAGIKCWNEWRFLAYFISQDVLHSSVRYKSNKSILLQNNFNSMKLSIPLIYYLIVLMAFYNEKSYCEIS
jgi:hypothetical protein